MKSPDPECPSTLTDHGELLAEIGHELRSPLTSILAFADALENEVFGPLTGPQKQAVSGIGACVARQIAQIRELIELRKFECGLETVASEGCHVSDIVAQALAQNQPLAKERKIRLIADVLPEDVEVTTDPRHLAQLIASLVQTGLMAASKLASVRLQLSIRPEAAELQIVVAVAQAGGDAEGTEPMQNSVTNHEVEQRLRKLSPIGLGLARHILAAHGGDLSFQEAGEVVVVRALLPVG